jgi:hypothetical protein
MISYVSEKLLDIYKLFGTFVNNLVNILSVTINQAAACDLINPVGYLYYDSD